MACSRSAAPRPERRCCIGRGRRGRTDRRLPGSRGGGRRGKCAWLVDELGFNAAVDYKAGNLRGQLGAACPEQVDLYFDNVAGDVFDAALRVMNKGGHVICCGMVSTYDSEKPRAG